MFALIVCQTKTSGLFASAEAHCFNLIVVSVAVVVVIAAAATT